MRSLVSRRRRRRSLVVLVLGVLAAALLTVPASAPAAAAVGHQVIDQNTCDPPNAFFVNCANDHFVFNTVLTPAGVGIGQSLFDIEMTATGVAGGPFEGCVFTANAIQVGHFTDFGEVNVLSFGREREVDTQICNNPADVVCITTFHVAFVNGRVVMDRFATDCEPVTTT
jgi:hypothetical protein